MEYGLIGKTLSHSFSPEIHNRLTGVKYELKELKENEVDSFFKQKNFKGINVTVPYKVKALEYLDVLSFVAKRTGTVNTVINKDGLLYGYNTDYMGLMALVEKSGVAVKGKNVLILGSGGTSGTAFCLFGDLGAKSIIRVSRSKKDGFITYDEIKKVNDNTDILVNTTPVGMYKDTDKCPLDLKDFTNLSAVFDVIYNPYKTRLITDAEDMGIKAFGGLYMLIAQAVCSEELFLSKEYGKGITDKLYFDIKESKRNIVLIGMPSSGKTTQGKTLAKIKNRKFYDTDRLLFEKYGKTPEEIIKEEGEESFRNKESEIIKEISKENSAVISVGGGAVLRNENMRFLRQNGIMVYLKKSLNKLKALGNRPLSDTYEKLEKIYYERKDLYEKYADITVDGESNPIDVANCVIRRCIDENSRY